MKLPLSCTLAPSRTAAIALILIHGLALASVVVSQIPIALKIALGIAIIVSLLYYLRVYAYRIGKQVISAITLRENGEIDLLFGNSQKITATVERSSTVLKGFIVLVLHTAGRRRRLWLLPDMLTAEHWRHLTIWLRTMAAEKEQAST